MKAALFETEHCYTVIGDDSTQYSVTVTHHLPNNSYAYEVESLDNAFVTRREHDEVLSFVIEKYGK